MSNDLVFQVPPGPKESDPVLNKLDILLNSMDRIESQLETLENRIEKIENSTKNMDDHIDFVNYTYMVMKKPMDMLKNMSERITGLGNKGPTLALPDAPIVNQTTRYHF